MTDPEFLESIHRELDGLNSEMESRKLHRRLESDAEALMLYRELDAMGRALSTLEEVEPPKALRRDVLNAIAAFAPGDAAGDEVSRPHTFRDSQSSGHGAPVLRYGWALAAGIVLGLFTAQLLPREASGIDGISGTMAPSSIPDTSQGLQQAGEWLLDGQGVAGAVRLAHDASRIEVAVDFSSPDPVYLVLTHDETVGVVGLSQDGTAVEIRESGAGHVVLGESGEHRYRVILSRTVAGPTTIDLGLFRNDELIDEYELYVGGPE